ncbi:MAG TPA: lytic murein transglycosylase [Rickettsiales bacterium]|nr:lytic murein transglycosylase [Rickettsiales bacterium]
MRFVLPLIFMFVALPVLAAEAPKPDFSHWLAQFKQDALAQGISQDVIDEAFQDIQEPLATIVTHDQTQPEHVKTFSEYLDGMLTRKRIMKAREKQRENARILRKITRVYHVQPSVLLALWSIESNFGDNQGDYSVIQSLATLAYDGRRSSLFRSELLKALKIIQNEDADAEDLTGSWAGAMGQTQFMPSSYLQYAVDFDDDGKKDIWNSNADALASIANYLHSKGWNDKKPCLIAVNLPESGDVDEWRNNKVYKTLKEWRALGFEREDGRKLPRRNDKARLIVPDDDTSAFLVFPDYDIIMDWNRSIYFATSVCLLSDKIGHK